MRTLGIVITLLAVAGCNSRDEQIKRLVGQHLKDPESAQYSDIRYSKSEFGAVCGRVNAKNSFGAYGGFQAFLFNHTMIRFEQPDDPVALSGCCDVLLAKSESTKDEDTPGFKEACGPLRLDETYR